jgi:hypothetical protein
MLHGNPCSPIRKVRCVDCAEEFQASGWNHKRCQGCWSANDLKERRRRAKEKIIRLSACCDCSEPFPPDVHAHQRRCSSCYKKHRLQKARESNAANRERSRAHGRSHYEKNKAKILERRRSPEYRRYLADVMNERRKDPGFRLHCNVSRLVSMALNGGKAGKSWQDLVGYTLDDLKRHLERQFKMGMTWRNYGSHWHVDHIIPRASFSFSSAEDADFKTCWALANLQPLESTENLKKSSSRQLLI